VVSALGGASLFSRDPAMIVGMHNIIVAMEQAGVSRFVYLSADTVSAARDQLSPLRRYVIVPLIAQNTGADHEINESMIEQSHLDWVIVRPPMLTNGPRTGVYRDGGHLEARAVIPTIARADLAEFMLKQLTDDRYLCQTPSLMY
jgi:putative NADH-flavin reductase